MHRLASPTDTPMLLDLAVATGLFQPVEAETLLGGVLAALHAGELGDGHVALVSAPDAAHPPVGWVYFGPDSHNDGVWNLWWIGVAPTAQGRGIGGDLLRAVEVAVQSAAGRVLVIETSGLPQIARTRAFYTHRGYVECGRVPDFYAVDDDKVIFVKRLHRVTALEDAT